MVAGVEEVERILDRERRGEVRICSVLLVTPGHVNGTGDWKMERLSAVWMCERSSATGEPLEEVFETTEGNIYTRHGDPVGDLRHKRLRLKLREPDR